jgi:hypothetical protein
VIAPSLRQLQRQFKVTLKSEAPNTLTSLVRENQNFLATERLSVYQEAYWLRLLKSLTDDFPAVANALGKKRMQEILREFLLAFPSRSWNISEVGATLPSFLRRSLRRMPAYIAELAELEWIKNQVYYLKESPLPRSESNADASSITEATTMFLNTTLHLWSAPWTGLARLPSHDQKLSPRRKNKPITYAVFRNSHELINCELTEFEAQLINYLKPGRELTQVIQFLSEAQASAKIIAKIFEKWTASGLLHTSQSPLATATTL